MPANQFDGALLLALQSFLRGVLGPLAPSGVEIRKTGDTGTQTLPLVALSVVEMEEVVFESGIYRANVQAELRWDIDPEEGQAPFDSDAAYGALVNAFQTVDLKTELRLKGGLQIDGAVLGRLEPAEAGDRMWLRRVQCEFFGYSVG